MKSPTVRDKLINFTRLIDDLFYENAKQTRILFIYTNNHGFSCQAPIIEALRKIDNIKLHTTTDKNYDVDESDFSNKNEYNIFLRNYIPNAKAVFIKWHLIIDAHQNSFYPKRNALRIGMHHGPGFGIMGNKVQLVENYDIFFGLSQTERKHLERIKPGIFDRERAFFPVGFPKSDALINNTHSREATRTRLKLDNRPTLLITSHWTPISTLMTFKQHIFEVLCKNFPDCNIIQTGHPWLWSERYQDEKVTQNLFERLRTVERKFKNAYFMPYENSEQLLKISDLLVADHSSVITTYSLLDRPIVWFENPDLNFSIDEIGNTYRGASHVFTGLEELPSRCRQALTHPREKAAGRQLMRETFYANPGQAGRKAAETLAKIGSTCSNKSPRWQLVLDHSNKPCSDVRSKTPLTDMKISAVVPTYNNAEFIEDAIDSILVQSVPVDEIIIVDDGSADNTKAIVDSIKKKTTNKIIYIKQNNQGPSSARNRGIDSANGDWIAFLDADDQWVPDKIACQLAALQLEPSLQLVAGDMAETDQQGKLLVESVLAKHHLRKGFQTLAGKALPNALEALLKKNFIPTGTVLVKRTALDQAGNFNPDIRFGEDLELWVKIAADHPITCLSDVMMYRRQHSNNATQSTERMLEGLVEVMRSLKHWGAEKLAQKNVNSDQLVANALCNLAYWHFSRCNYKQARKTFTSSLKEHTSKRALIYAAICLLPDVLIKQLKSIKQNSQ